MSSSQTGDRHTEGRAADVVQAHIVAELDGGRITAVLAADAQLDVGASLAAQLGSHLHQLANAVLIQTREGIALEDLVLVVAVEELAGVVAAEAEGHLSQVVGAEGEELGFLSDLISGHGSARDLDPSMEIPLSFAR